MKGDFSRIRFNRAKSYTSVLSQQGRVALDADANEQRFIDETLRRAQTVDVVGEFGGPVGDEGFAISFDSSTNQIMIGPGRYYVGGLLCENPQPIAYDSHSHLAPGTPRSAALLAPVPGTGITLALSLQVWQRLVTALDDPCLLEPALGQAFRNEFIGPRRIAYFLGHLERALIGGAVQRAIQRTHGGRQRRSRRRQGR